MGGECAECRPGRPRPHLRPTAAAAAPRTQRGCMRQEAVRRELPQHSAYRSGSARPAFRGALHAAVAASLSLGIVATSCATLSGTLPERWWLFVLLLLGKFLSYFSSAMYHTVYFSSREEEYEWLKADLTAVSLAMWAFSCVFSTSLAEWILVASVALGVTVLNHSLSASFISAECAGDTTLRASRQAQRAALLLAFFLWTIAVIGWHYGFTELWWIGVAFFIASFAISPAVHKAYPAAPWHAEGLNGWHEDFHVLLAVADVDFGVMGHQFLSDPGMDQHPPL